jgi:hypothetical protein
MQKITSRFLSLDTQDFVKSSLYAVGAAVAAVIGESFSKGIFTLDITNIWHTAAATAIACLTTKFLTGAKAIKSIQ